MKYVVVILDGAAGEALDEFDGLTSLQVAHTPHLDALAASGRVGLSVNVPDSLEPSSNVACTSILGYDPLDYPVGRGALELSALKVALADDEVALRANLCHVSPNGIMASYSTNNISSEDGHALADELKQVLDDDQCRLYKGTGFRLYLVVRDRPGLMQTKLSAAHEITDLAVKDFLPAGPEAAFITDYMARAHAVLAASAVNQRLAAEGKMIATDLMCFWPGQRPQSMEAFTARYGLCAAMSTGVDLLAGIANLIDMDCCDFPGVTDGPDNDYAAQGEGALSMLADHDLAFVHVEAPDAEGHDGNAVGKKQAIEAIDREIIGRLCSWDKEPLRILALPDHPTPVASKRHSRDPVPFVLAGPGIASNGAKRLTEVEAAGTGLVVDPGWKLLGTFLSRPGLHQLKIS
ncbi:MAG: 2,3-bisphosphoglycerate-independent phosphoglycerate mutase [Actinomycetia bacterium]|nr:2,3-bisphosphoglycerate-independent phosphoglycerate mutase [Actinomycetes bacterium]